MLIFNKINKFFTKVENVKQIYIIIFIFLIAFLPRLILINDGLFHHDSVQLAIATEKTLETGKLHPIVGGRYGLVLINAIAYSPFYILGIQSSEFVITVTTIIFASLAVLMLYLFMKELFDKKFIAITSSLLFSFYPLFFSVSTFAKGHAFSVFFILLAAYSLLKALNTADICVSPDEYNEMNNKSTMNKIMEYMALKKPIVQFDLEEGRVSAQNASLYAKPNDSIDLAKKILQLIDDPKKRKEMGEYGYERVKEKLQWKYEKENLYKAYRRLFSK